MAGDTTISPIPDDAIEVITEVAESGGKQKALYLIDGKEIGFRFWYPNGVLGMESGLRDGVRHGLYRDWHDNAQLCEEGTYYEGKEHGETKQYDYDGVQIGSYVMDHGTGVDLWLSSPGVVAEERELLDGERHGYERWWNDDNRTVHEESHFRNGIEHGIFRRWNLQQKLRRGYPQYFIMGKRVTKRQYERACQDDSTLPPFLAEDNQPVRPLPKTLKL